MLGFDRNAARYVWTVALVLSLLMVFYLVRKTLFIFVVAILLAYVLSPLVNLLDRAIPTRTRAPALAIAYALVIGIIVVAGIQIGSRVADQAAALTAKIPEWIANIEAPAPIRGPQTWKEQILSNIRQQIREHSSEYLSMLPKASLRVLLAASDLIYVIVVPILSFFFLKDGRAIRARILELVESESKRELLKNVMADVNLLLAQYMRALFILCLATFIFYSIFFSIIGVPYALLLASLAFALEFIPMIGPLAAAAVILLVAVLNGAAVLPILIFLAAYRLFQDYILSPHLMSSGMELHPLLVIFGVFAGAEIAGVPGAFISVPVLALLRIMYRRTRKARMDTPVPSPVA